MSVILHTPLYEGVHSMRIAQFDGGVRHGSPCSCGADHRDEPHSPLERTACADFRARKTNHPMRRHSAGHGHDRAVSNVLRL